VQNDADGKAYARPLGYAGQRTKLMLEEMGADLGFNAGFGNEEDYMMRMPTAV